MTRVWASKTGRFSVLLPAAGYGVLAVLAAVLVVFFIGQVALGTYTLSLAEVWATLTGSAQDMARTVVFDFRIPRALAAMLAGALLAVSGAILQALTRNPLADPSLVGVSQGGALAVVSTIILFPAFPPALRPLVAFVGAMAVAALVQALSDKGRGRNALRFILIGIAISSFLAALIRAFLTYGDIRDSMSALSWLAGSVHSSGWQDVAIMGAALAVVFTTIPAVARRLSVLQLGEEAATGLGLDVRLNNRVLLFTSVALAAVAVAAVGPLVFIGLIAPQAAKRMVRTGAGMHLLLTALTGAIMVIAADLAGRTLLSPTEIPAGVVTAIIGAPVFLLIMLRRNA
ncbi:iron ABC transporter permease [Marivivens donghaensis]|uniref:Iron ABC transporter permease n=1 Tax=Marivivens donghaensis TaxID=1699413 RepID=A0ABX0W0Q3_9RHOB|nr:iron ABC transporter permease [Marivivens donghaensis]NIY73669.1 iron ABC transporter permease [Marivivens donghaensis]